MVGGIMNRAAFTRIYEKIKKQGILIRHFATPGIEDFLRISIGDENQMNRLCEAFEHILA